jgi:hypothetical protein
MAQKMPGYGIERVVYMLNRETVCLSPALRDYYVLSPGHLLLALEGVARRANRPDHIFDRHMVAFISVREPKMIDPHLGHLISQDRSYQIIGMVRTLAAIQRRFQIAPVPALGNWVISQIDPAINRYHDADIRKAVKEKVMALQDSGNLMAILELIDNPAWVQEDLQRFTIARREYALLSREASGLMSQLQRRDVYGMGTGRQVAMLVSAVIGVLWIMLMVFMHFSEIW